MKLLLLGIAFTIAGAGCLSFAIAPFFLVTGLIFTCLGLLLAVIGACKKEEIEHHNSQDKTEEMNKQA